MWVVGARPHGRRTRGRVTSPTGGAAGAPRPSREKEEDRRQPRGGRTSPGLAADLLVGNQLVVELEAVKAFAPIDRAKVVSYLRATGCHLALLINF